MEANSETPDSGCRRDWHRVPWLISQNANTTAPLRLLRRPAQAPRSLPRGGPPPSPPPVPPALVALSTLFPHGRSPANASEVGSCVCGLSKATGRRRTRERSEKKPWTWASLTGTLARPAKGTQQSRSHAASFRRDFRRVPLLFRPRFSSELRPRGSPFSLAGLELLHVVTSPNDLGYSSRLSRHQVRPCETRPRMRSPGLW